ncbi:hypothetical protein [uncultured Photobacterium sp.]|uniref:hypothetical protein n=1 Tax=uncultured Photobacterium sp. TaxID=173973 RepID=UPI0026195A27|nr:hypothetical protein [uncultured Photobacterium sp.]
MKYEIKPYSEFDDKERKYFDSKNQMLKDNNVELTIIGYIPVPGKAKSHCAVVFDCPTHGDTSKFGNPYTPMVSNLGKLHDCGCNKCSGKYSPSKDEVRAEIAENIHPNREFLGFVGEYKNRASEVMVRCRLCGEEKPTSILSVIQGKGCKQCETVNASKRKGITGRELKQVLQHQYGHLPDLFFEDIGDDDKYQNDYLMQFTCKRHKITDKKKVLYLRQNRYRRGPCPECCREAKIEHQTYSYEEQYQRISEVLQHCPWQFSLPNVDEGNNSRVDLFCRFHNYPFDGRIGNILQHKFGCKYCGYDRHHLKQLLLRGNLDALYSPREFYKIHLKEENGNTFFKYGVTSNGVFARYSPKNLAEDRLVIVGKPETYDTTSITALLMEAYLMSSAEYNRYRIDKSDIMKKLGGGTECFSQDVIANTDFETLSDLAWSSHKSIIAHIMLGNDDKIIKAQAIIDQYCDGNTPKDKPLKVIRQAKSRKLPSFTQEGLFEALRLHGFKMEETAKAYGVYRTSIRRRAHQLGLKEVIAEIRKNVKPDDRYRVKASDYLN